MKHERYIKGFENVWIYVRQSAIYLPNWGGGVIGGRVFNPRQQQA